MLSPERYCMQLKQNTNWKKKSSLFMCGCAVGKFSIRSDTKTHSSYI